MSTCVRVCLLLAYCCEKYRKINAFHLVPGCGCRLPAPARPDSRPSTWWSKMGLHGAATLRQKIKVLFKNEIEKKLENLQCSQVKWTCS